MLKALAVGATLFASLAVPVSPASAASSTAPDKMVIDVVSAIGSGCPKGSASVNVSPDRTAFTVAYSEYTAQVGVGAKPTEFRKNCQLALNVRVPQGFTYAIARADYRGFVSLARGSYAAQTAFYYFQGNSQTSRSRHVFNGPAEGNWQRTDSVGVASLSFLPCGEKRYLNVNTELRVEGGSSDLKKTTSLLTMDSTDGRLDTVYHIRWKKC